jgi:hypothetical protein
VQQKEGLWRAEEKPVKVSNPRRESFYLCTDGLDCSLAWLLCGIWWLKYSRSLRLKKSKAKRQKSPRGKAKASLHTEVMEAPTNMKMTEWRYMQPWKDANLVTPVLQQVVNGELSLQEMDLEFKRIKVMMVVQRAFLTCLAEATWDACKTKYHLCTLHKWVAQQFCDHLPELGKLILLQWAKLNG